VKIAYFDAPSGISGDMTVAALLDAGRDSHLARFTVDDLAGALTSLGVSGYRLALADVEVDGVRARSFDVAIDEAPHHHRDWATIRRLIEAAGGKPGGLSEGTVERSLRIFEALAVAEAKVHRVEPDEVHFHEVGAIDSIVDIVGAAWCLDRLGIEACFVGPLPSGSGYVDTEHGRLAVPAPATIELLRGFDVVAGDGEGELVTPTGAAILSALARPCRPLIAPNAIGCGAGTRRLADRPNVLRVLVGECDGSDDEQVFAIEADVDDMTPAGLAYVAERLRADGARDVSIVAAGMKKGRLGLRVTVLCDLERLDALAERLLCESTTIGVRYRAFGRRILARRVQTAETEYGKIALKVVERPDGSTSAEPEFEEVAAAARAHGVPLATVQRAALERWKARQKG